MLIDRPEQGQSFVALVVENDAIQAEGVKTAAALRRAGIAVEVVASGSPRKRYDRAVKLAPGAILSLDQTEGATTRRFKSLGGNVGDVEGVLAALA
jgi:histidyl-tRNA synthetase